MRPLLQAAPLLSLLLLPSWTALAQAPTRAFNCVGVEDLEEDVFAVPFAAGSTQVTEAARSILAAAAERIRAEPDRNICILGHADREGGQSTKLRLAAGRARSVVEALVGRYRVERDRMRSEARVAGFSRRTGTPETRSARIVILPPQPPVPERGPPRTPPARPEAPPAPAREPVQPPPSQAPASPVPDAPPRDAPERGRPEAPPAQPTSPPAAPAPATPPSAPTNNAPPDAPPADAARTPPASTAPAQEPPPVRPQPEAGSQAAPPRQTEP
ncbi:OmpA family protein [Roseomonas cutis]|uniref:OmpA family protein n=1 Tax=Roseomonas cutis TaxID=2897332 RepID=UPI00272D8F1F|nr:OmpA family protein [Roseomonas sp. OT10]